MSNLQHLALFMFLIFLPAGRSLKTILKRKLLFDVIFHRVIPDMHKDFRETSLHTFSRFERGVFSIRCVNWFHLF